MRVDFLGQCIVVALRRDFQETKALHVRRPDARTHAHFWCMCVALCGDGCRRACNSVVNWLLIGHINDSQRLSISMPYRDRAQLISIIHTIFLSRSVLVMHDPPLRTIPLILIHDLSQTPCSCIMDPSLYRCLLDSQFSNGVESINERSCFTSRSVNTGWVTGYRAGIPPPYLTSQPGQPSVGRELSTGWSAVMLCGWE